MHLSFDLCPIHHNNVRSLLSRAAKAYGLRTEVILSRTRVPRVVFARHQFLFELHDAIQKHFERLGIREGSVSETARTVGMDHTSVLWAIEAHAKRTKEAA